MLQKTTKYFPRPVLMSSTSSTSLHYTFCLSFFFRPTDKQRFSLLLTLAARSLFMPPCRLCAELTTRLQRFHIYIESNSSKIIHCAHFIIQALGQLSNRYLKLAVATGGDRWRPRRRWWRLESCSNSSSSFKVGKWHESGMKVA